MALHRWRTRATAGSMLERPAISIEKALLEKCDRLNAQRGYGSRSEAMRDLIREQLLNHEWSLQERGTDEKVAVVSLVHDLSSSSARKVTQIQRENHTSVVSSVRVHLDEHNCLEVLILRGPACDIIALGDKLVSTKGGKHGKVLPATAGKELK
jgi:CopG family transcriptional regulator, nickel-responsive regulator